MYTLLQCIFVSNILSAIQMVVSFCFIWNWCGVLLRIPTITHVRRETSFEKSKLRGWRERIKERARAQKLKWRRNQRECLCLHVFCFAGSLQLASQLNGPRVKTKWEENRNRNMKTKRNTLNRLSVCMAWEQPHKTNESRTIQRSLCTRMHFCLSQFFAFFFFEWTFLLHIKFLFLFLFSFSLLVWIPSTISMRLNILFHLVYSLSLSISVSISPKINFLFCVCWMETTIE